jgi:outer membrane protein TolC
MSDWEMAAKELSDARREFSEAESRLAQARATLHRAENAFDTLWKKKTMTTEYIKHSGKLGWDR